MSLIIFEASGCVISAKEHVPIKNGSIRKFAIRILIGPLCLPNVPRQQSLAGGAGGSQRLGAKALGLLFCQQALCLSGGKSDWCSSKLLTASD